MTVGHNRPKCPDFEVRLRRCASRLGHQDAPVGAAGAAEFEELDTVGWPDR